MNIKNTKVFVFFEKSIGFNCLKQLTKYVKAEAICAITTSGNLSAFPLVSDFCQRTGISLLIVDRPNDLEFIERIKREKPQIAFAISYSKIFKQELISSFPEGIVNLHPALLPRQRGCYPTMWSIIEGDKATGYTLHFIDAGIDTGSIIAQASVEIEKNDTGESLYAKQVASGEKLFDQWARRILIGDFTSNVQSGESCYHPKKFPFDGQLPWTEPYDFICRVLRAFKHSSFRGAVTNWAGKEIEVFDIEPANREIKGVNNIGDLQFDGDALFGRCRDCVVRIYFRPL